MLEQLHSLDTNALIALNRLFPAATDTFWLAATKTITWLPLYAVLLHRLYISSTAVLFVKRLALVVIGVLLFDQGAALFKYTLERPRPCHDLEGLRVLAHCSPFGFFSAHAANSFGLAFLFRKWAHSYNGGAGAKFFSYSFRRTLSIRFARGRGLGIPH
jgi:undecaprenyl-diphosphatase